MKYAAVETAEIITSSAPGSSRTPPPSPVVMRATPVKDTAMPAQPHHVSRSRSTTPAMSAVNTGPAAMIRLAAPALTLRSP